MADLAEESWQERDLPAAIAKQEFALRYQPIVSLPEGRIVAVEALISWDHPVHGRVAPNDFIPIAEQTDAIIGLGAWVLNTACDQVRHWQLTVPGLRDLRVAVNVSANQLDADLPATVACALERSGLAPDCLEIEVTESAVIADMASALKVLETLGDIGVGLSIDDFGTGFSSLAYLKQLPVTGLKIDKVFIDDLTDNPRDASIVAAVIALAAALGMTQIAEGVETEEQRARLESLGCAFAQGYLFSRPLSPASFLEQVGPLLTKDRPAPPPTAEATPRVVLCDDEESIRKLYRRALQSCDVTLVDAATAAACLTHVAEVQPHLVVLDISLPDRGGLEIMNEIWAACPTTRIVVISGLVTAATEQTALGLGAEACVGKLQFLPQLRSLVSGILT